MYTPLTSQLLYIWQNLGVQGFNLQYFSHFQSKTSHTFKLFKLGVIICVRIKIHFLNAH